MYIINSRNLSKFVFKNIPEKSAKTTQERGLRYFSHMTKIIQYMSLCQKKIQHCNQQNIESAGHGRGGDGGQKIHSGNCKKSALKKSNQGAGYCQ